MKSVNQNKDLPKANKKWFYIFSALATVGLVFFITAMTLTFTGVAQPDVTKAHTVWEYVCWVLTLGFPVFAVLGMLCFHKATYDVPYKASKEEKKRNNLRKLEYKLTKRAEKRIAKKTK